MSRPWRRSKAASTAARVTVTDQVWLVLPAMSSPSSTTTGNAPPAVRPPLDAPNSVRAMRPSENVRTCPAVAAMAPLVRLSSWGTMVDDPEARRP